MPIKVSGSTQSRNSRGVDGTEEAQSLSTPEHETSVRESNPFEARSLSADQRLRLASLLGTVPYLQPAEIARVGEYHTQAFDS